MSLWQLILRQLRQRSLSSVLTALSVALGVMLVSAILLLQHQMERHFLEPGRGYSIVVGAPGSALQLVLNGVYHMDKSPGLLPMRTWLELEEDDSVALAVPYAVGDSFHGYRVVATTDALFDQRFPHPAGEGDAKLAEGRPFHFSRERLFETLEGLGAARLTAQEAAEETGPLDVFVRADGTYAINDEAVALAAVGDAAGARAVHVLAEAEAPYPAVMALVEALRAAGAGDVQLLVSEHEDEHEHEHEHEHEGEGEGKGEGEHAHDEHAQDEHAHDEHAQDEHAHDEHAHDEHEHEHEHGHDHDAVMEAVLGAEVAAAMGIHVGDEIEPTHGVEGGTAHDHEHLWKVVGILKPTGTPVDRVVFINLDSFFAIDEHAAGALLPGTQEAGLSTVLVFPRPGVHKAMLLSKLNRRPDLQVADVNEQVRNLFTIVGSVDVIFLLVSVLVVLIGVLSILVAIYNTMSERRREVAILRAIGAHRRTVFGAIVGEATLLTVLGALGGLLLGHALVWVAAGRVEEAAGFRPEAWMLLSVELLVLVVVTTAGALAGIVPAWKAYRTDVAESLRPLS